MLQLLPNEQIITQSSNNAVILTTHRIYYEYSKKGNSNNQSIMLKDIITCNYRFSSQIIFLIFAGICLIGGFLGILNNDIHILRTLIVTTIFIALYLMTRLKYIIITSKNNKMKIRLEGMKKEQVKVFINKIEQARNNKNIIKCCC